MKIIAKVDDQHIVITAGANVSNSVKLYTVNYTFCQPTRILNIRA